MKGAIGAPTSGSARSLVARASRQASRPYGGRRVRTGRTPVPLSVGHGELFAKSAQKRKKARHALAGSDKKIHARRWPTCMRLLFVKLKHIGDSLLLTPTLTAARSAYPEAEIWVVVRRGCEGILGGCRAIDRLLTAAAPETEQRSRWNWWQDLRTIRRLRQGRFDYAFELSDGDRGRWIAALCRATVRCTSGSGRPLNWWWKGRFNCISQFPWQGRHRVEKDFFTVADALPLKADVPPLTFAKERTEVWPPAVGLTNYAVIHPGTRWRRKRWPEGKWIEIGRYLLGRFSRVIVSAGPDAEEVRLAETLQAALGPQVLSTGGRASWAQLAGLLHGATLFVGVDTAAMHLAAACQCPTVAIFGPSSVAEWRPWKVAHRLVLAHRLVRPDGVAAPESGPDDAPVGGLKTQDAALADVTRACEELLLQPSLKTPAI
jgi:heptosyltransferase III